MEPELKLEGLDGLADAMRDLSSTVNRRNARAALKGAAEPLVEAIKAKVPVNEGKLRDSYGIHKMPRKLRVVPDEVEIGVGSSGVTRKIRGKDRTLPVGRFIEHGTISQPARPHVRPAFDTTAEQMIQDVAEDIGGRVRRSAERAARKAAR